MATPAEPKQAKKPKDMRSSPWRERAIDPSVVSAEAPAPETPRGTLLVYADDYHRLTAEIERLRAEVERNDEVLNAIAKQRDYHVMQKNEQADLCSQYVAAGDMRSAAAASGNANSHLIAASSYSQLLRELETSCG